MIREYFIITFAFMSIFISTVVKADERTPISSDTTQANLWYELGKNLLDQTKYDSSILYLKKAAVTYHELSDWKKSTKVNNTLFTAYLDYGQNKQLIELAYMTLKSSQERLNESNIDRIKSYRNYAVALTKEGYYDSSFQYHNKAIDFLNTYHPSNEREMADNYYYMGILSRYRGKPKEGISLFENAKNKYIKALGDTSFWVSQCYNALGIMNNDLGNYDKAIASYHSSLKLKRMIHDSSHISLAFSYNNIGAAYETLGQNDSSIYYYQKALKIKKNVYGDNNISVAMTYKNIGLLYSNQGAYHKALDYLLQTKKIEEKLLAKNDIEISNTYNNLGLVYMYLNKFGLSKYYYDKALKILESISGKKHISMTYVYNNMGLMFNLMEKYDSSLFYHKKALNMRKGLLPKGHAFISDSYHNVSYTYYSLKQFDKARDYVAKALKVRHVGYPQKHPKISTDYNLLGLIYSQEGKYKEAIANYDKAVSFNLRNVKIFEENKTDIISNYISEIELFNSLEYKAEALIKQYDNIGIINNLTRALDTYLQMDSLTQETRRRYVAFDDRILVSQRMNKVYEEAFKLSIQLYELTSLQEYKEYAYLFAEKNKAALMNDIISSKISKRHSLLPQRVSKKQRNLKVSLEGYKNLLLKSLEDKDSAKSSRYESEIFLLKSKQDSLAIHIKNNYSIYYDLMYANEIVSIREVQKTLETSNTTILEYMLTDSILYTIVIAKDNFEIIQKPIQIDLHNEIISFRDILINNDANIEPTKKLREFTNISKQLYNQLLEEVLKVCKTEELIIIPDNIISYVPFELLLSKAPSKNEVDYSQLNYLIKDYSVSYDYSLTLKNFSKLGDISKKTKYLGYAPDYSIKLDTTVLVDLGQFRNTLVPLKWNIEEVNKISESINGTAVTSNQASEYDFKSRMNDYSIIHLAMHGLIDDKDPMNSKLAFTQGVDSIEDGFLHTYELFNMKLTPELVVLSACNTGYGKLYKGEGLMSLAYGFAYAGCPSLVASQWQVNDKSTSELMQLFYKHLKNGEDKHEALRNAKLEFLKIALPEQANPFYWGGFVLIGDTESIEFDSDNKAYWYVLAMLIVLLGTIVIIRKRRRTMI